MIKVKKDFENAFEIALKQGFAVNFYQCEQNEMRLSLSDDEDDSEVTEYAIARGWELIP